MENHSDETLFQALKEGSESAFKKVYEENRELFLNFARRYSLADEEVLDAYQDAYVALYENIQNGKLTILKSSLSTYLISIGKYKIMERLRNRNKHTNNELLLNNVEEIDDEIEAFDIDNDALSTEQKLLKKYFDALGKKCQKILKLFYYQQYNIKEIMTEGNYNSENVVKSQKSRCLKTLKEAIKNAPKL
ncbi:RNA polymerase sigma-70 factor, ECF subfamily [Maribacter dokdonensis]|uniref:RNA polymerase sigma-70 factor, ECF subfamily n=1 Tax=Maribacter dokdonensis TaxID=320912 RepID=A0A1H4LVJ8_9FLAO|nr:sigma-70 family RNA polymerase sigma factor [Maribacter dokdonensis]SEB74295.1 RNA polymerase sigma-70 factor, ECF subfamily [Maribacter dokdonensis]